jgi:hypothetical protein
MKLEKTEDGIPKTEDRSFFVLNFEFDSQGLAKNALMLF